MDTGSLLDAVRRIDEAATECHPQHRAEVKFLREFFRDTVEQVDKFLRKMEELGLLGDATIDAAKLAALLAKCLTYVEDRSSLSVWQYIQSEAALMPARETIYSVTSRDLENGAKAAVREGILEPVIISLECSMRRGGSPFQQRVNGTNSTELVFAIEAMDRVLHFGYPEVTTYKRRLGDARKIDDLIRSVAHMALSINLLHAKSDKLAEAMAATRITLEKGDCPLVFFIAPPVEDKHTWLHRVQRLDVINKRMELHFVCRVFFDDLRSALSQRLPGHTSPDTSELSIPLEVKKPRKWVTTLKPLIKLSIFVIDLIIHAAASGIGMAGLIPHLSLSEHDQLLELMKEHLEALDEATGADPPPEDSSSGVHGSAGSPDMKLLYGSARAGMQQYLKEHHATTWQAQVDVNLEIAINKSNECGYICRHNPQHKEKWRNSG